MSGIQNCFRKVHCSCALQVDQNKPVQVRPQQPSVYHLLFHDAASSKHGKMSLYQGLKKLDFALAVALR